MLCFGCWICDSFAYMPFAELGQNYTWIPLSNCSLDASHPSVQSAHKTMGVIG